MDKEQKNPNRIAKVNSKIQIELGEILREFLEGEKALVTITRVETSKDMKWAQVWIDILPTGNLKAKNEEPAGDHKTATPFDDKILKHIQSNIYEIQGEMNRKFTTKIVPRLQFVLDLTPRYVQHIDEVIRKIHQEDKNQEPNSKNQPTDI